MLGVTIKQSGIGFHLSFNITGQLIGKCTNKSFREFVYNAKLIYKAIQQCLLLDRTARLNLRFSIRPYKL